MKRPLGAGHSVASMRGIRPYSAWVVAVACVLVAAACGSTVDPAELALLERDPLGGAGPVQATSAATPGSGPSIPGDPSGGPGPGGSGGPIVPPPPPGTPAVGVDADTMTVGFLYAQDQSEANAALGAGGITGADEKRIWDILIEDLNARGGIAGRRVVPVFHPIEAVSNQTIASQLEEACQTFTRDHQVYAALGGNPVESYVACLERAGTIALTSSLTTFDERGYGRYPNHVEVVAINLNRMATALAGGLARGGYLTPGASVGVLTYDSPSYDYALDRSLVPALEDLGVEPVVEQISEPEELSEFGALSAQVSGAVLRFKTLDISHVILFERQGEMTLFFLNEAEAQDYHPRYGLTSSSGNSQIVGSVPEGQLAGARSIGWFPYNDLTPEDSAKLPPNPSRARCVKLMADGGVTFDSTNAAGLAASACDQVWFLEQAVERAAAAGAITTSTWLAGVHGIGTGFVSGETFRVRFAPDQHDGVAAVAAMAFIRGCSCFRYTTAPYAID